MVIAWTVAIFLVGVYYGKMHRTEIVDAFCKKTGTIVQKKVITTAAPPSVECGQQTTTGSATAAPSLSSATSTKQPPLFLDPNVCPPSAPRNLSVLHIGKATVPQDIFPELHHPASPAKWNYFMTQERTWPSPNVKESPCQHIYLTRTGQRASQPNKCVSVVWVSDGATSIVQNSHRIGYTALNTNQYQQDYPRDWSSNNNEKKLLFPFLLEINSLVDMFIKKMGNPIDPKTGKRRMAIVMVTNEGVFDLLLNFLCSAEGAGIDIKSVVVFVGDAQYVPVVENMGANAIYSPSLGSMPAHAAEGYLDHTFARMMWFKTTSVYLALKSGYHVLFQDVDLVWLKDPRPYFDEHPQDILFMDDGARTPR